MSAVFKNSKKKPFQSEFRKILNEQRGKSPKDVKKIESPLARYNDQGQLTCILCKSVVRSETVWNVHINAKQHRENVELAKKLKQRTNNFTTPLKRPLTPPYEVPDKKLKGILKNSSTGPSNSSSSSTKENKNGLPDDFFDSKAGGSSSNKKPSLQFKRHTEETTNDKMDVDSKDPEEILPEGFFDDPKLDAKARNQEYRDPIEEEWEKFKREIKEADSKSSEIIAEDQEESTTERQISEIDEQIKNFSRVLDLEKRKVSVISVSNDTKSMEEYNSAEESDEEFVDEFLDWRSKRSFK